MTYQLLEPILDSGVRNSHYFNGRLLTADALRQDQAASREQRQQLGRAIGAGIVEGLAVTLLRNGAEPVLKVTAGLALNAEGQALSLPLDSEVALVKASDPLTTDAGLFAVCVPPVTSASHSGRHVYILVLAPASGYRERVPMVDLATAGDSNGRANGCGYRYAVEGVQFRLVRVRLDDEQVVDAGTAAVLTTLMDGEGAAAQSLLRNRLAHLAFGTAELSAFTANLFDFLDHDATPPRYGLVDRLIITEAGGDADMTLHLNRCDVPLAMLYWTPTGVQWVDMWAVRRRLTRRTPSQLGVQLVSDRRVAEGEAAFLQFQAQVAEMTRPSVPVGQLAAAHAREYFHYLPAAGIVPVMVSGTGRGFHESTFFSTLVTRPVVYIEGDQVNPLLRQSFLYECVRTSDKEFLWLYQARENRQAIAENATPRPSGYLVFASGHLPEYGVPRYDLARFNYSNFA